MRNGTLLLLLSCFFLLGSISLTAQVTTAAINGSVADASGEPLVGATVKATHGPSGAVYGTTTRSDGRYNLPNLRVGGPYTIEISYLGYETQTTEGLNLTLAQKLNLSAELTEESTTLEGVTITADRNAILDSKRTGAATNITTEKLEKLPTISRSASDYYRLTPSSDGNSFAGRNDQFNQFSLDGSIFNNPFGLDAATPGGQSSAQPVSLDAIEQINVSLAPYDVTQAGFTGAAVNAVTKSGTNDLKGTVFGFFRNQDLTGSKVAGESIVVPDLAQTQAGFSLGGPLVKNKVFFFVNAEIDQREDLGTTFVASRPGVSGSNVSRVTAEDLEAVSSALKGLGYDPGLYEGYLHNTNSFKGLAKLDFVLNENNTLTATYNFLDAFQDKPAHPSAIGRRGPDATTLQFQNAGYRINNLIHSGIVELRSLFGNNVSNKLQVGYTSFRDSRDPFSDPIPVININKDNIRYIVAGHEPFSINNRLNQDVLQFTNNLNIYSGNHTFTVGVSLERFDFDNSFNLGSYDPFTYGGGTFGPGFQSVQAFVDTVSTGGFADELANAQGVFQANGGDEGELGQGWALAETNVGQFAVYAQDEWAVSDKFTFTYGVRMDLPLYFNTREKIQENLDRNCCYDPSIIYYTEDGDPVTYDHLDLPAQTPLISPRIGFNYDVKGDQSSQLRGGTGLFSGRLPFVWIGNQVANPNSFFYNKTANDFSFPQVWRSNLGYDTNLGNGWILSLDAIYTKDLNAAIVRNYSLRPPGGTLNDPADQRPVYRIEDHSVGFFGPIFGSGYVFDNTNIGYSFNFSAQIQKQFENGLYAMLAYNFTDAQDASSIDAEISSDAFERNPAFGNVNQEILAPSLYGTRHRIIGSAYKTFEYGNWATTFSTFFQFAQGGTTPSDFTADYRFSYTYSGDINGDGSGLNDLIYVPTDSELNQQQWVSDAQREAFRAYIEQDPYLSENRGEYMEKYAILAPWNSQWDVRALQNYKLANGNAIQFSLDILNFGNLLNSNWGVKQLPTNTQPVGVSVGGDGVPTYSFDTSLTETFINDFSLATRWQMRLGLRYIF